MSKNHKDPKKNRFYALRLFPTKQRVSSQFEIVRKGVMSHIDALRKEFDEITEQFLRPNTDEEIEVLRSAMFSEDVKQSRDALYKLIQYNKFLREDESYKKNMAGINLEGVIISNINLVRTNWSTGRLKDIVFLNCDLSEASFNGNDLSGCIFENCNLSGANFAKCDVSNAWFNPSDNLMNGYVDFRDSNLRNSILIGNFSHSIMINANMTKTWFRLADLRNTNMYDAILTDAVFDFARLNKGTTMPNGNSYHIFTNPTSRYSSTDDPNE